MNASSGAVRIPGRPGGRVGGGVADVGLVELFHIFNPGLQFRLTLGEGVGLVQVGFRVGFAFGSDRQPGIVCGEVGPQGFAFGFGYW